MRECRAYITIWSLRHFVKKRQSSHVLGLVRAAVNVVRYRVC